MIKSFAFVAAGAALALMCISASGRAQVIKKADLQLNTKIKKLNPDAPDLAAVNITGSFVGDPMAGTADFVAIGVVRNVGSKSFSGYRWAQLHYKNGTGPWQHAATRFITYLAAGDTFHVPTGPLPSGAKQPGVRWRLKISAGDYNPANDVYYPPQTPTPVIK